MSSSSHRKIQLYYPVAIGSSTTQKMKSSWSIGDSMKKLTITNETTHRSKVVTDHKGRVGLKQEVVNRRTETAKDRCKGTVKKSTYEVVTKNPVVYGKEAKGNVRLQIKDKKHGSHQYSHHQPREVVKYESRQKYYRHVK